MTSVSVNSNDAGIEERLEFVRSVLRNDLGFKVKNIKPIAYEENFPFPYNNFVYVVEVEPFPSSSTGQYTDAVQPGTQPIPGGSSSFVFRLPNKVSGYNKLVRVENEVAALDLARTALHPQLSHLVPSVFAWASDVEDKGWLLQEYMPGVPLHEDFKTMNDSDKVIVLSQLADILGCLQRFKLPDSIQKFGGISYDRGGAYMSAPMSIYEAGPFDSYEALVRGTILFKLSQAEHDPNVHGWHANGVRARLDAFLEEGLQRIMNGFKNTRKTLVHADLSTDNVLYDRESKRLTAVFDFDFAHIGTIADEFFRSLGHGIGRFPDTRDGDQASVALQKAMLEDFSDPRPIVEEVDWPAAEAWNNALKQRGILRPASIPGMQKLADVFWLSSQILPFKLCNPVVVGNSTPEQLTQRKKDGETRLQQFLTEQGF